jgi:hypothetical protein
VDKRSSGNHPVPLDLLLDEDGNTPHGAACATCSLFPVPGESRAAMLARLGALYRAEAPVYRRGRGVTP